MTDDKKDQNDIIEIEFSEEDLKSFTNAFSLEALEVVNQLDDLILRLEQSPADEITLNNLFRKIHTLKGSVGSVPGGQLLGSLAHEFEAVLSLAKSHQILLDKACIDLFLQSSALLKELSSALANSTEVSADQLSHVIELIGKYSQLKPSQRSSHKDPQIKQENKVQDEYSTQEEETIKLSKSQLEKISQMASRMILIKNQAQQSAAAMSTAENQFVGELNRLADDLQKYVQEIKKHPLDVNLKNLGIVFRQTCLELNKDAELQMSGQSLLVDKSLGQDIATCLLHLLRNSLDHGIEDSFDRTVAGKNPKGQLQVTVNEVQNHFEITFRDDGKGLDPQKILKIAIEKELITEEASQALSINETLKLIFRPGFSTKEKVTKISGRGMGMDIVQGLVDKYQGTIDIHTELGQFTEFKLRFQIPQSILVESCMIFRDQDHHFAIPISSIQEVKKISDLQLTNLQDIRFAQFQGKTIPALSYYEQISNSLQINQNDLHYRTLVIAKSPDGFFGLIVEEVRTQMDLVVKPLHPACQRIPGVKGLAVISANSLAYILDVSSLSKGAA